MTPLIAIIEDDETISQMYTYKLQSSGYRTIVAYNGKDGLKICEAQRPDLILLDLRMPIMNGDEMLEKLRATEWGSKMRVIVLTNISKDEAPRSLSVLNIDRYIVKAHYTPQQIVEIIQEVIKR
jgi:DNA-binding response OmpR family regulator